MIYLDNAATSWPKPDCVISAMTQCLKEYCANPGRGSHGLSSAAGLAVSRAREKVAEFFNIKDPLRLCFTKNATEALNTAIYGVLKPHDYVIATGMEHNSVLRPLKTLERDRKISLTLLKGNRFGEIDLGELAQSFRPETRLVVSTLSSNVNGIMMPIAEIGEMARSRGALFLVDASQGAGSVLIDVESMNIDLLAFPGHKGLMGPQGTGGLYVGPDVDIKPLMQGGTGSNSELIYQPEYLPDLIESGTLNTPGIVGLASAIDFIRETGIDNIGKHRHRLVERLHEGISRLEGITVYSRPEKGKNSGIVAFNFDWADSNEIAYILDKKYNIAVRAGLHCAPAAHATLGTLRRGAVRISPGWFNTMDEIEYVIKTIEEISRQKNLQFV